MADCYKPAATLDKRRGRIADDDICGPDDDRCGVHTRTMSQPEVVTADALGVRVDMPYSAPAASSIPLTKSPRRWSCPARPP